MNGIKFRFTYTGSLIAVWYANTAPLAEVGRQVYSNAVSGVDTVLYPPNLLNVTYTFKFFRSSNGTTLETLLAAWGIDATLLYDSIATIYEYVGDRGDSETDPTAPQWADPITGDTEVTDERLNGATQEELTIFKGQRFLLKNEYSLKTGGGITILNGEEIYQDEPIIITRYESVISQNQNNGNSVISTENINIVSGSGAFGAAYFSKENIADGGAGLMTTTFPLLSSIPDNTVASFSTYGGSQRYWVLKFQSGEGAMLEGSFRNAIYLRADSKIKLFFTTTGGVKKCHVIDYKSISAPTGQRIWGDKIERNTVARDGTEYAANEYPKLYEWIDSLPADQTITYGEWNANKGLFAIDASNASDIKFKVPDDRDMFIRGLKTLDGVGYVERPYNVPGAYQGDALDFSNVAIEIREGSGGSGTGPITNKGFSGQDNLAGWVNGKNVNVRFTGEGITTNGTRPKNIGLIPLILI